ncbi:hypothetical protein pb186bvf_003974 [Paramecium bursaria]
MDSTKYISFQFREIQSNCVQNSTLDQYTAILAPGAYESLKSSASFISAQVGTYLTPYATSYINGTLVAPMMSILVTMDKGTIKSIQWDNVCFGYGTCPSTTYSGTDGNTYTAQNDFIPQCANSTTYGQCDPKIYFSYTGTDQKGAVLTSAGMRMSKFRQYSFANIYKNAQNAFSNTLNETKQSLT